MSTDRPAALYRGVVLLFAALCVLLALITTAQELGAQDGASYVAAGRLALEGRWDAVYPWVEGVPLTHADFDAAYCAVVAPQDCGEFLVPFVSPPPMLVPSLLLALLPDPWPVLLLRLLAGVCIGWGTWRLWRGLVPGAPALERPLAIGWVLLLTFALYPIEIGQTIPLLFAAAVAGWAALRGDRRAEVGVGLLLGAVTVVKLTPALLALVLLAAGRRRALVAFGGVIGVHLLATAIWVPVELWAVHAAFLRDFGSWVLGWKGNTSVDAAWVLLLGDGGGRLAAVGTKVALLGGVALAWSRGVRWPDLWLLACGAYLAAMPLVWWHYLWVLVAVWVGIAGARVRTEAQGWALVVAMLPLPVAVPWVIDGATFARPLGAVLLLGGFFACLALVLRRERVPAALAAS